MATPHIFKKLLAGGGGEYRIVNRTRDLVLATRVETAFDSASRRKGLLGRRSLPSGTALAIAPSNGIHTFGMQFAIGVLFISRDGHVVKRLSALAARRVAFAARAFAVLEFCADDAAVAATQVGDQLLIEEVNCSDRREEKSCSAGDFPRTTAHCSSNTGGVIIDIARV